MRVILQRVQRGLLTIEGQTKAEIGPGLVLLIGVGREDGPDEVDYLAKKVAHLRVFEDDAGKTNLSLLDVGGEALVVSQFTLYADTRKGRRPSFVKAALPDTASPLVDMFAARLAAEGIPTQAGTFGARMVVEIVNDGPMTIFLER